jgi:hypothetical protein
VVAFEDLSLATPRAHEANATTTYFQTLLGYGRRGALIDQTEVLVPAGRYGIHQLDACKTNLLPSE